jgi:uncharacterized cupredoxin-like copper-binding protein
MQSMNVKSLHRAAVAAFLCLATSAYAATSSTVVHVSLQGEADQPMSVKLDNASAKAGMFEFDVSNDAIATDHEVVLIKVKKGQKILANMKKHRVNEKQLQSMGEVGGLKPGDKGTLNVQLVAGDYVLLCNHKSHYELGMATVFTVTN